MSWDKFTIWYFWKWVFKGTAHKDIEDKNKLIPERCLFQIVEYTKQLISDAILPNLEIFKSLGTFSEHLENEATSLSDSSYHNHMSYLIIDHICNESCCCKIIKKLSKELNISCNMVNCSLHNLYVELVRDGSDVGQFLKLWKSQNIDVD